jgi:hypothetical protein
VLGGLLAINCHHANGSESPLMPRSKNWNLQQQAPGLRETLRTVAVSWEILKEGVQR